MAVAELLARVAKATGVGMASLAAPAFGFLAVMSVTDDARAQMLEVATVKMNIGAGATLGPILYALDKGWFREGGFDVRIEDGTGSVATVNIVGNGHFDIGVADLSVMATARSKGLPLRAIAGMEPTAAAGILVPRDSSITTLKDLVGKRVISDAASFEAPFLDTFYRNGGIRRDQLVNIQISGMAKVAAYASGQGDALITNAPVIIPVVEKSRPSRGILFKDYGLGALPSIGYFATERKIKEKPRLMRVFVSGISRSLHDIVTQDKVDEAVASIIKNRPNLKLNPVALRNGLKSLVPFMQTPNTKGRPFGWQSSQDWAVAIDLMKSAKLISASSTVEEFFTNEFVPVSP